MSYKSPEAQREYQRAWLKKRREEWLAGKKCSRCGSDKDLEIDHEDSTKKVNHRVWSWSKKRREVELAKCQVLCRKCHLNKSAEHEEGQYDYSRDRVDEVIVLSDAGLSRRKVSALTGISRSQVVRIVRGQQRKDR